MLNYGGFSPEQQQYIMQHLPDLQTQEDEMARQLAQASALRIQAPTQRMDWASQAARAVQGVGSGLREKRANDLMTGPEGIGAGRRKFAFNFPTGQRAPAQFNMFGPGGSRPTITDEERLSMMQP